MWVLAKTKQQSISVLISNQKKKTINVSAFHPKSIDYLKKYLTSPPKNVARIRRFKLQDDSSELMITDYTAVKKRKLDFEPRTLQWQYTDITTIMNELELNHVIHIHAFLSNVSSEMMMEGWEIS